MKTIAWCEIEVLRLIIPILDLSKVISRADRKLFSGDYMGKNEVEKVKKLLSLEPGEIARGFYQTKYHASFWKYNVEGESGMLVLTNFRLLFYKAKGFARTFYELKTVTNLQDLTDISLGGLWNKYLSINGIEYFLYDTRPDEVIETIRQAVKSAKEDPTTQGAPDTIFCTECGFENRADAKNCKNCGASTE